MAENRCWICLVDKTDDDDNAWSTPCSCSLIAHKECLLVWVQSKLSDDADSPVQCPQCGERYRIVTRTPPLLRPLRSADKLLRRISPLATIAGLGLGVSGVGALYGAAVARAVLGPLASASLLNKPQWSWRMWSSLSLVPWALMFYNSNFPDKFPATYFFVIPYSYIFPVQPIDVAWPPSPMLTLACVPPLRAAYGWCRARLAGWFTPEAARGARRETFSIAGAEFQLQYGNDDEGEGLVDENENENEVGNGDENNPHARDTQFRYKLTLSTVCRYLTTTLAWPFASRLLADLLLGVRILHPVLGYTQKVVRRSPIPLCLRDAQAWEFAGDPVWLRTAIAAATITLASDCTQMLYSRLELSEKESRSVENKKQTV
ncbi:hypothetical protein E3P92_01705 [Wallemia ichthyophaga]|uniref:E3 ubiquitin-protein ligase MARCH5 n=1 Tax=Wallemia ichthyophaga (strain EXF-994 / CBS 113033) TaxID=1299270 RepID=R9AG99_WALI9|nr:E3 ubiquitin-protein ligase MARCH5 [Wallemia ichthyophaga EXF-994]TIA73835.1 hypothetical protein E3P91_01211 [Wallemia ichthyophaga]EOR01218.1 E3 ubiquitin-protein ligase MARCH5 [Wallemia ichthyophaga EXF-994]TIA83299.1 hypothetical protein E3P98_00913 [Wallemia ichthyophaga]TIB15196.1 hypothetical protein E3P92_01705 [Wallemia ichthyophaga]TIB35785.1 hypothetical protein E3P84_01140 [Wallemia ichthyophaga]